MLLQFFILFLVTLVKGDPLTTLSLDYNSTANCTQCVLNGDNFCAKNLYGSWSYASRTSYQGYCAESTDTCSLGYTSMDLIESLHLRVSACENIVEYCGAKRDVTLDEIGDVFFPIINYIPLNFSCSYHVKSTCGAPIVEFSGSANSTNLTMIYLQFTDDLRISTNDGYPQVYLDFYDVTNYCTDAATAGFCDPDGVNNTVHFYARTQTNSGATSYVQFSEIIAQQDAYRTSSDWYTSEVNHANSVNNWDDFLEFFGLDGKEYPFPDYIGLYTGYSFDNTQSLGGYGDPTVGEYDIDIGGWLTYGALFQDTENTAASVKNNTDTNQVTCQNRYLIATLIPTNEDTTESEVALTFRANHLQTSYDLSTPSAPTQSGIWISATLATFSFVAFSVIF